MYGIGMSPIEALADRLDDTQRDLEDLATQYERCLSDIELLARTLCNLGMRYLACDFCEHACSGACDKITPPIGMKPRWNGR